MATAPDRTRDRTVVPMLLLGLALLFGGLYAAAWSWTGDRVPEGTRVGGVDVGGLRPAAAERLLSVRLAGRAAEPISILADGRRSLVVPSRAGMTVDVPASVRAVTHRRSWDPRRLWDYLATGADRDPVVSVDRSRLASAVATVATQVDRPAISGSVGFVDGEPVATYPRDGLRLDQATAASTIRAAFLRGVDPGVVVRLPTRVVHSPVSAGEVSRAMDTFANPATSAAVVVRLPGRDTMLPPSAYTRALSMVAVEGRLMPRLDRARLLRELRPMMRRATRPARDATVSVVDDRVRVVPSRDGLSFRGRDVTRAFVRTLTRTGAARVLDVRGVPVPARTTTRDVRRLRISEPVSSFTTRFPYAAYRNVNLPRAAHLVDGTVLRPGQTFSLNGIVGQRTAANGFTKGFVISDGVFRQDFGGGVSQVATTLFNAAFFAGLQDVEHRAHSFYIDRYPVGREATVVWPSVDLRFKNTTPYGVLVQAEVEKATPSTPGTMHVTMWSTRYWDIRTETSARYDVRAPGTRRLTGSGCVANQGSAGFDVDVFRLFYPHGSHELARRERIHTAYAPADTVVCS